jgi:hypothetical protein
MRVEEEIRRVLAKQKQEEEDSKLFWTVGVYIIGFGCGLLLGWLLYS